MSQMSPTIQNRLCSNPIPWSSPEEISMNIIIIENETVERVAHFNLFRDVM